MKRMEPVMNDNTLRSLLLSAATEYQATLCNELEAHALPVHVFSKRYKKRKHKQLQGIENRAVQLPLRSRKRWIAVLIALLVMLFSAFSVQAIREPIIRFSKR